MARGSPRLVPPPARAPTPRPELATSERRQRVALDAVARHVSPRRLVAILTEAAGRSPDFATLFVEFNQALSEGRLHSLEGRNESNTTPTEFEEFAAELAHAYAATA